MNIAEIKFGEIKRYTFKHNPQNGAIAFALPVYYANSTDYVRDSVYLNLLSGLTENLNTLPSMSFTVDSIESAKNVKLSDDTLRSVCKRIYEIEHETQAAKEKVIKLGEEKKQLLQQVCNTVTHK